MWASVPSREFKGVERGDAVIFGPLLVVERAKGPCTWYMAMIIAAWALEEKIHTKNRIPPHIPLSERD
jgi:hypothetical protein